MDLVKVRPTGREFSWFGLDLASAKGRSGRWLVIKSPLLNSLLLRDLLDRRAVHCAVPRVAEQEVYRYRGRSLL